MKDSPGQKKQDIFDLLEELRQRLKASQEQQEDIEKRLHLLRQRQHDLQAQLEIVYVERQYLMELKQEHERKHAERLRSHAKGVEEIVS